MALKFYFSWLPDSTNYASNVNYLLPSKRDGKKDGGTQKNMCVWKSKGKVFSFFRGLIDKTISTLNWTKGFKSRVTVLYKNSSLCLINCLSEIVNLWYMIRLFLFDHQFLHKWTGQVVKIIKMCSQFVFGEKIAYSIAFCIWSVVFVILKSRCHKLCLQPTPFQFKNCNAVQLDSGYRSSCFRQNKHQSNENKKLCSLMIQKYQQGLLKN